MPQEIRSRPFVFFAKPAPFSGFYLSGGSRNFEKKIPYVLAEGVAWKTDDAGWRMHGRCRVGRWRLALASSWPFQGAFIEVPPGAKTPEQARANVGASDGVLLTADEVARARAALAEE
jgi:aryl-alcohol dehydrogenase-like predicted oxidoreductase